MKVDENMSEDDRDIDIESDDDNDSDNNNSRLSQRNHNTQNFSQADKRAHHNALERKRRDHIKDSFNCLREAVPSLQGEKVASRAQILKKTADYIQVMRHKNQAHEQDIDALKAQNANLEAQIRFLEKAKDRFGDVSDVHIKSEESDSSDADDHNFGRPTKKLKTNHHT